jgi:opacity protein-like surface antigen
MTWGMRAGMRHVAATVALAAATLGFTSARAADPESAPPPPEQPRFEVAAFGGFSLGGSFTLNSTGQRVDVGDHGSLALALDAQADEGAQYELSYSRQSTTLRGDSTFAPVGVTVEYLHIGGTVVLDDSSRLKPYLLGGLGITRFGPPAPGLEDTRFSASLGLGLRMPVNKQLSLRLEARGLVTLISADTSLFCRSDQTGLLCQIHGHGSTFLQGEALAGVAYAF